MAIMDKTGLISIWDMLSSTSGIKPVPFLDISSEIVSNGDRGLLGLAFHKKYIENGRLFVAFTCRQGQNGCKKDGDLVVDEYVSEDPASMTAPTFKTRILYVDRVFKNAIGGQLLFSPSQDDSNLFVFVGDGGQDLKGVSDPFNNAQNLQSLLGKVLRLDIDRLPYDRNTSYAIPEDNPFVDLEGVRKEIYAFGLRNPWRCSFDRRHPVFLFCGDVGHAKYEEVNRIIAGGNYGWRYYEGRSPFNTSLGLGRAPIVFGQIELARPAPNVSIAIIGGYVYCPEEESVIDGTYYFADEFGKLYSAISVPGAGQYRLTPSSGDWECAWDSPVPCGDDLGLILSFFKTAGGDLYMISTKAIFQIVEPFKCKYFL